MGKCTTCGAKAGVGFKLCDACISKTAAQSTPAEASPATTIGKGNIMRGIIIERAATVYSRELLALWNRDTAWKIIEHGASVCSGAGFPGWLVAELAVGSIVRLGVTTNAHGAQWVGVYLDDGREGVMPAETKVLPVQRVFLHEDEVAAYSEPCLESVVVRRYARDSALDMIGPITVDGKPWIKIRGSDGNEEFIQGTSRIEPFSAEQNEWKRKYDMSTRRAAMRDMTGGTALFILGILVSVVVVRSGIFVGGINPATGGLGGGGIAQMKGAGALVFSVFVLSCFLVGGKLLWRGINAP